MKTAVAGCSAVTLGLGIVLVMMMAATVGHSTARHTAATLCTAMLGEPPTPTTTVADLGGPAAAAVAEHLQPAIGPLTGMRAYRFVSTLNTITNWHQLAPEQLALWAGDPHNNPAPAGAHYQDDPWPSTRPDASEEEKTLGAEPPEGEVSLYESACSHLLVRTEATPSSAAAASGAAELIHDRRSRRELVGRITARMGTTLSESALWQLVSLTPERDATRTLFDQLMAHPHALTSTPQAGDLACYDFTTAGPAHCALLLSADPATIAALNPAGVLIAAPIPANHTSIAVGRPPAEKAGP